MIISTEREMHLKKSNTFQDKNTRKTRNRRELVQLDKCYKKPITNIILIVDWMLYSKDCKQNKNSCSLYFIVLGVLYRVIRKENEIKRIQNGKEEVKLFI